MKIIIIAICLVLVGCKTTEGENTKLDKSLSSKEELILVVHGIGGDNKIQIPSSWDFNSHFMPVISGTQPVNYRIKTKGMIIALTGFPSKNTERSIEKYKASLDIASTPYKSLSKEGESKFVAINNPNAEGGYSSFSCKNNSNCFKVLRGVQTEYVTTALMMGEGDMVYSISIATNSLALQEQGILSIKSIGKTM